MLSIPARTTLATESSGAHGAHGEAEHLRSRLVSGRGRGGPLEVLRARDSSYIAEATVAVDKPADALTLALDTKADQGSANLTPGAPYKGARDALREVHAEDGSLVAGRR
jgi:hypothetical protein